MDDLELYWRERARTERATAFDTSSPQARRAHLELALRYVKAAEACHLRDASNVDSASLSAQQVRRQDDQAQLGPALGKAFALPGSGAFTDLLGILDEIDR